MSVQTPASIPDTCSQSRHPLPVQASDPVLTGSVASPEGSVASPEVSVASPEGCVASPEGSVASPERSMASPGESMASPEGSVARFQVPGQKSDFREMAPWTSRGLLPGPPEPLMGRLGP